MVEVTPGRGDLNPDAPGNAPRDGQLFGRSQGKPRIGAPSQRWQARLTDDDVRELRKWRNAGKTYGELSRRFGISPAACYAVVTRQTYKHV